MLPQLSKVIPKAIEAWLWTYEDHPCRMALHNLRTRRHDVTPLLRPYVGPTVQHSGQGDHSLWTQLKQHKVYQCQKVL